MFVPYPESDGLGNAADSGRIWCEDPDIAGRIASQETIITGVNHKVVVVSPDKTPAGMIEIHPGVFCKPGEGFERTEQRVKIALS